MENIDIANLQDTRINNKDYSHIKGWGVDADRENDPTYPMRDRENDDHAGYSWKRPTQQKTDLEILHSNERPNLSAVFGTAPPPKGLSGMIRRFAFRFSENEYGHWLPLIMADKINVVEGVIEDLMHARIPNIFAEKGAKASWKYDTKNMVIRTSIMLLATGALAAYIYNNNKKVKKTVR
ncbi:MAG TPA: hypothetical protein VF691_17660 [Cytophagaceae bacterium]|jgi:hypothetical protein